ncbi:riboflavin synthase [candidate division WOR-3 bacterium]|nr:riboflavin synthase [candidate division WOR-3 bacterium]
MFTGLIEETGILKKIDRRGQFWEITVSCCKILEDLKTGDSVCTDGMCLTAIETGKNFFKAQMSRSTVNSTKSKHYRSGDTVNLERAMKADGRIGGHFVQGHVETTGKVLRFLRSKGNSKLEILVPSEFSEGVSLKGYIAVDGISLTINAKKGCAIEMTVIEETYKKTNLRFVRQGLQVNIERDFMSPIIRRA